ncbi:hypothetical protein [Bradyrhizobium sp. AUGA SZCCT0431]|uniref:hypothetical protein n=1 Tax=Bradyrhizobium sp. AUGA SZCCT0431 TaxID=2807674 RepID=UPI001BAAB9EC|nr:hypothetical protein [Bradyrhizobium sp. AUGA SZCCT0431]MBR1147509.1 hypothetical protein [Bradyrhizobium sp. AUGA SZCCT0431]
MIEKKRNQAAARRIARLAYPYPGCCLCGQTVGEEFAHLDHEASNNDPDNLAWLCNHHHWMYDIGLFSAAALKLQRTHWQEMKGKRTNAFMKDAGKKAAATRAARGIGSEMAKNAVATRRANALKVQNGEAAKR